MNKIAIVIFILMSCDFSTPIDNHLVNLNEPIIFFNVGNTQATVESLPGNVNVTSSTNWSIEAAIFSVSLESITQQSFRIGETDNFVYQGFHPSYNIYLESPKPLELSNFDSLSSVITIEILNSDPRFNGLTVVDDLEIQVRALDEFVFQKLDDVNTLRESILYSLVSSRKIWI